MNEEIKTAEVHEDEERSNIEVIEAMLFAAGFPIEISKLAEILMISELEVRAAVLDLQQRYENEERGIQLVILENACQLCTKEKYESYVRAALGIRQSGRLSNSCLEVLAIIAYNQPITKALVDEIRKVDSAYAIGVLIEKNLIEVKGKSDAIGRPNLYGTTDDFLRVFGIGSLSDLPESEELGRENEQIKIDI